MYIRTVELENFKQHRKLKLEFDDITVIVGVNAKGKTTVLDAISYCLYGVTADGATKKELLTNESALQPNEDPPKKGSVTLTFDNGYKVYRDLSSTAYLLDDQGVKVTDKSTEIETWLNIPRDMFMTLIYGVQGKMADSFIKFNAGQKDFIDQLFSINEYTTPILNCIAEVKKYVEFDYNDMTRRKNDKITAEDYIKTTLSYFNCESLEELKAKISEVDEQIKLFGNIDEMAKLKQQQSSLVSKRDYNQRNQSSVTCDLKSCQDSIDKLNENFITVSQTLQQAFQTEINTLTTEKSLRDKIQSMCDMQTWLNQLYYTIESLNVENLDDVKSNSLNIIQYINQIDNYRNYYNNLIAEWNKVKWQVDSNTSNINKYQKDLERLNNEAEQLNNQLESLNSVLSVRGAENESLSNIEVYKELINKKSSMVSYYQSLQDYIEKTKNIVYDENKLINLEKMKAKIATIEEIFKRDGFPQFMRNMYIKDVASMMNDMLLDFGFDQLLPVTVNNNGEFLYRGVKTKSISGAQKVCTSIIQKFIYGRILAPGMKLGIMILDEPTYGFDNTRVEYLKDFLTVLNKSLALQLIIVTHKKEIIPETAHVIEL